MKNRSLWIDNQPISIFGEDVGAFYYEERALLAAEPGDIVIVDYEVEPQYLHQLRKISSYRLVVLVSLQSRYRDLVESILNWENIDVLKDYIKKNNFIIRSYIPDERISLLSHYLEIEARGIGFYEDNKRQLDFTLLLNKMQFETIETLYLNSSNRREVVSFFEKYRCILAKPNLSIGGRGIFTIKNLTELMECYELKKSKTEYILQKKIKIDLEGKRQILRLG